MFTIYSDNTILAGATQEAAPAEGTASIESFSTEKELASLAANWPANRLVEIWNGFAGAVPFDDLKPVSKFKDRKTAVARIWSAIQRLDGSVAPQAAQDAPEADSSTNNATPKKKAATPPKGAKKGKASKQAAPKKAPTKKATTAASEGSKTATVLELIGKAKGATLKEIMEATGWQAHSVRGFISGTVGKKMGLTVESSSREDGERVYKLAK